MKRWVVGIVIAAILVAGGVIWSMVRQQSKGTPQSGGTPSSEAAEPLEKPTYQMITADEAKAMMDKGNVTIVDVRRQDEYDAGHVKDAILVPNESIGATAPEALPDKDAVLLVYCRTGIRAENASQKLIELGYTHVYDFGGIVDWPYEIEK